jgi:hypothetical protein
MNDGFLRIDDKDPSKIIITGKEFYFRAKQVEFTMIGTLGQDIDTGQYKLFLHKTYNSDAQGWKDQASTHLLTSDNGFEFQGHWYVNTLQRQRTKNMSKLLLQINQSSVV